MFVYEMAGVCNARKRGGGLRIPRSGSYMRISELSNVASRLDILGSVATPFSAVTLFAFAAFLAGPDAELVCLESKR